MNKILHFIIKMFKKYDSLRGDLFLIYLAQAAPIYLCLAGLALTVGFYNIFQKSKIKHKFLTKNIIYAIYWHIGMIIFLYFVNVIIIFIITIQQMS